LDLSQALGHAQNGDYPGAISAYRKYRKPGRSESDPSDKRDKACWQETCDCVWRGRVKSKTPLHEQVKVTWEVDKKGKARITNIAFIAKENASIRSCLQNVIQSDTSYPRSSEATSASLTIRYELAAAGQGSSDSAGR